MDEQDRQALANSDVPRHLDPRGDAEICPPQHAYNKYPPFSRERIIMGLLATLAVIVCVVVVFLW
ncbi:MAG: hypothetical protein IPI67_33105 [Myxococcales bacterium]|nr:hypothetical protein [Myxococcales bacterium]